MKLRVYNATIKDLSWYPTEEPGGSFVLVATAPLKPKLAEKLRAKELCFDEGGVARKFEGQIGLTLRVTKASVELGDRIYESKLIHKFRVGRKEGAADNDISLHLTTRMHFDGNYAELPEWCRQQNKGEFTFCIEPAQGELQFTDDEADEQPVTVGVNNSSTLASKSQMKRKGAEVN